MNSRVAVRIVEDFCEYAVESVRHELNHRPCQKNVMPSQFLDTFIKYHLSAYVEAEEQNEREGHERNGE